MGSLLRQLCPVRISSTAAGPSAVWRRPVLCWHGTSSLPTMGNKSHFWTLPSSWGSHMLDLKNFLVSCLSGNCCFSGFLEILNTDSRSFLHPLWSSDMVGISGQGVSRKKYQASLSRVSRRKVRGCIFVQCCGSLYGQVWKGTVWSNHGSLFTHGHSTANIQGKTARPVSVTKQMALRKPRSHERYPQFSPYIGRKRHIRAHVNQLILAASGNRYRKILPWIGMQAAAFTCSHKTDL